MLLHTKFAPSPSLSKYVFPSHFVSVSLFCSRAHHADGVAVVDCNNDDDDERLRCSGQFSHSNKDPVGSQTRPSFPHRNGDDDVEDNDDGGEDVGDANGNEHIYVRVSAPGVGERRPAVSMGDEVQLSAAAHPRVVVAAAIARIDDASVVVCFPIGRFIAAMAMLTHTGECAAAGCGGGIAIDDAASVLARSVNVNSSSPRAAFEHEWVASCVVPSLGVDKHQLPLSELLWPAGVVYHHDAIMRFRENARRVHLGTDSRHLRLAVHPLFLAHSKFHVRFTYSRAAFRLMHSTIDGVVATVRTLYTDARNGGADGGGKDRGGSSSNPALPPAPSLSLPSSTSPRVPRRRALRVLVRTLALTLPHVVVALNDAAIARRGDGTDDGQLDELARAASLSGYGGGGGGGLPSSLQSTSVSSSVMPLKAFNTNVNAEQWRSVQHFATNANGSLPFVVHGPPGTGKTLTVIETANQLLRAYYRRRRDCGTGNDIVAAAAADDDEAAFDNADDGVKLLICTPSDGACDLIVERLAPMLPGRREMLRFNAPHRHTAVKPIVERYCCHRTGSRGAVYEYARPSWSALRHYKVIVTTCVMAAQLFPPPGVVVAPLRFSHILIDEAAQATTPESLLPLSHALGCADMLVVGANADAGADADAVSNVAGVADADADIDVDDVAAAATSAAVAAAAILSDGDDDDDDIAGAGGDDELLRALADQSVDGGDSCRGVCRDESECVACGDSGGAAVLLAGDHRQLGPVVHSAFAFSVGDDKSGVGDDGELVEMSLATSLLERLMRSSPYATNLTTRASTTAVTRYVARLRRNYRSHPLLLALFSALFYRGRLLACAAPNVSHSLSAWRALPTHPDTPLLFHGVVGNPVYDAESGSYSNALEAVAVVALLRSLLSPKRNLWTGYAAADDAAGADAAVRGNGVDNDSCSGDGGGVVDVNAAFDRLANITTDDVGIIAPYRKQVLLLRKLLRYVNLGRVRVGTVDDYQGLEERAVFVSTTVSAAVARRRRRNDPTVRAAAAAALAARSTSTSTTSATATAAATDASAPAAAERRREAQRFNVGVSRAQSLLVVVGDATELRDDPNWNNVLSFALRTGAYGGAPLLPSVVAAVHARASPLLPATRAAAVASVAPCASTLSHTRAGDDESANASSATDDAGVSGEFYSDMFNDDNADVNDKDDDAEGGDGVRGDTRANRIVDALDELFAGDAGDVASGRINRDGDDDDDNDDDADASGGTGVALSQQLVQRALGSARAATLLNLPADGLYATHHEGAWRIAL
jgi:hypothetical protein